MLRLPVVISILTVTSSTSNAAVFGADDRQYVVTSTGSPYAPVGLVLVGRNLGTGTLINRCDVLTAKHVYRAATISRDPRGERATFQGAVASTHSITSEGTIIAAGGYRHLKPSAQRFYDDIGSDWMIVRLDECLGDKLGWASLVTKWPADGTIPGRLQDAGFPMDRDRKLGLSVDPDCSIRAVAPRVLFHDCATMLGNSGGPIFRLISIYGVQRMEIVGIVSGVRSLGHEATSVRGQENLATAAWNVNYDPSLSITN